MELEWLFSALVDEVYDAIHVEGNDGFPAFVGFEVSRGGISERLCTGRWTVRRRGCGRSRCSSTSRWPSTQYLKEICELCGFNEPIHITGHADYKSIKPYIDIAEKAKTDAMDAMDKALNG